MNNRDTPEGYFDFLLSRNKVDETDYFSYMTKVEDLHGLKDKYSRLEMIQAFSEFNIENKKDLFKEILEEHGDYEGIELSTRSGGLHVVITKEAQEEGKYRSTTFNEYGFLGHSTRDTAKQVLEEKIKEGFTEYNPGIMDKLAITPNWEKGMQALARIDERRKLTLSSLEI